MGAAVRRRAINSRTYASIPYCAARTLIQLRRGHRAWPMFELKSGAAMAAPMPPPLIMTSLVQYATILLLGVTTVLVKRISSWFFLHVRATK